MPERLDRVTIALDSREVTISWDARQALMRRLYDANVGAGMMTRGVSTDGIIRSIEAVGASRAVELTKAERQLLRGVLELWSGEQEWSLDPANGQMPTELVALRDALNEDVSRQSTLDSLIVWLNRETLVVLNGDSRELLMRRLQPVQSVWPQLSDEFGSAEGGVPLYLSGDHRRELLGTLEKWSLDADLDDPMPRDLLDLRDALRVDLRDRG